MLERWRLHRGLHPLANGLSVTAASDTPLDTLMMSEIEAWYQRLLTDGPEEWNDPVEYSANIHLPSTLAAPVAVVHPGGFVTLWPSTGDNIPDTLRCTARRDDMYHFDQAALQGAGSWIS